MPDTRPHRMALVAAEATPEQCQQALAIILKNKYPLLRAAVRVGMEGDKAVVELVPSPEELAAANQSQSNLRASALGYLDGKTYRAETRAGQVVFRSMLHLADAINQVALERNLEKDIRSEVRGERCPG